MAMLLKRTQMLRVTQNMVTNESTCVNRHVLGMYMIFSRCMAAVHPL
jgi:hypothetical protein